jgi:hypothetical protein
MDRVISLLAALVGLIALGGAILVHVNADAQRSELAAEIAGLRGAMGNAPAAAAMAASAPTLSSSSASSSSAEPPSPAAPDTAHLAQIKAVHDATIGDRHAARIGAR